MFKIAIDTIFIYALKLLVQWYHSKIYTNNRQWNCKRRPFVCRNKFAKFIININNFDECRIQMNKITNKQCLLNTINYYEKMHLRRIISEIAINFKNDFIESVPRLFVFFFIWKILKLNQLEFLTFIRCRWMKND